MNNATIRLIAFLLLFSGSFFFLACQSAPEPQAMHTMKVETLEFNLPSDLKKPPQISKGKADIYVRKGDEVDFRLKPGSGAVLLVINETRTPFTSGAFTVRLTPGKSFKETIAPDRIGEYKYTLIDVSGGPSTNRRPPLDPRIIVRR